LVNFLIEHSICLAVPNRIVEVCFEFGLIGATYGEYIGTTASDGQLGKTN
jgi:hypothetical protein